MQDFPLALPRSPLLACAHDRTRWGRFPHRAASPSVCEGDRGGGPSDVSTEGTRATRAERRVPMRPGVRTASGGGDCAAGLGDRTVTPDETAPTDPVAARDVRVGRARGADARTTPAEGIGPASALSGRTAARTYLQRVDAGAGLERSPAPVTIHKRRVSDHEAGCPTSMPLWNRQGGSRLRRRAPQCPRA